MMKDVKTDLEGIDGDLRILELSQFGANCAVHEHGELSNLKVIELIQVGYVDPVQLRGVNSGNEVLQILASTFEFNVGEREKDGPCHGRQVYSIRARRRRSEFDSKGFEPG